MKSVLSAALILAIVAGCRSEDTPTPPPPAIDGLVVLTPGLAPYRELRYRVTKGAQTRLELVTEYSADIGELHQVMPAMVLGMTITVEDVLAEGHAKLRTSVTSSTARERPGSDATTVELMAGQARLVVGLVYTQLVTPRGRTSDTKIEATNRDFPAHLKDSLTAQMQKLDEAVMTLPERAVGLAGAWRYRKTLMFDKLQLVAETTITIVGIHGDHVEYRSISKLTGPDQKLEQSGMSLEIKNIAGLQLGGGVIDLSTGTATDQRTFTLDAEMTAGDMITRHAHMTATIKMSPAPPEPVPAEVGSAGSAGSGESPGSASPGSVHDHGAHNAP